MEPVSPVPVLSKKELRKKGNMRNGAKQCIRQRKKLNDNSYFIGGAFTKYLRGGLIMLKDKKDKKDKSEKKGWKVGSTGGFLELSDEEILKIKKFEKKLKSEQKELDPESAQILEDNFWDLV